MKKRSKLHQDIKLRDTTIERLHSLSTIHENGSDI